MKLLLISLNNKRLLSLLLMLSVATGSVLANANVDGLFKSGNDKIISKARAAVENASQDDWETYAKSAELCIEKNINMKEASKWLEHSISIKKTTLNLRIKGDYYLKNKLPRKAMEYYLLAIETGKANDFYFDSSRLQSRIDKARNLEKKLI